MITGDGRSPLTYIGGKAAAARRILAAFLSVHDSYDPSHEPCSGAAPVRCTQPHGGPRDICHDLNKQSEIDDATQHGKRLRWLVEPAKGEAR